MNLKTLTASDAHRIVNNWINANSNYMKVSYRDEIALRETLTDWTLGNRRDVDGFYNHLKERFPLFCESFNDV